MFVVLKVFFTSKVFILKNSNQHLKDLSAGLFSFTIDFFLSPAGVIPQKRIDCSLEKGHRRRWRATRTFRWKTTPYLRRRLLFGRPSHKYWKSRDEQKTFWFPRVKYSFKAKILQRISITMPKTGWSLRVECLLRNLFWQLYSRWK